MIRVNGKKLHGEIASIPSKSYAHRAIIAAALSDKPAKIIFNGTSDDIEVTINCLRELGSEITRPEPGYIVVNPIVKRTETPDVYKRQVNTLHSRLNGCILPIYQ